MIPLTAGNKWGKTPEGTGTSFSKWRLQERAGAKDKNGACCSVSDTVTQTDGHLGEFVRKDGRLL